ncbi:MAG: queuosine precursor transporter [Bacteroidia bacterium]|nr:queuosine precursor transporter [Bacteroidia bacterium]
MDIKKRKDFIFILLSGFFITNAVVAELIGGKLIRFFGLFTQSIGIILWPVVFLLTDIMNEHFGKVGVRRLTYITVILIVYVYIILTAGLHIPAVPFSPVSDEQFSAVFGQSQWIIVGSITAFLISQLADIYMFWVIRNFTGGKWIWMRATGSTVVSQLIDTFVVQFIAFVVPGKWAFNEFLSNASMGYIFKLITAALLIPFIYIGHHVIKRLLKNPH